MMSEQLSKEASGTETMSTQDFTGDLGLVDIGLSPDFFDIEVKREQTDPELEDDADASPNSVGSPETNSESTPEASAAGGKRKHDVTLPLPAGSLPPRKRAKTKDEKEQRRVERILRNRQAAHASREKKRRHMQELEVKCDALEAQLAQVQRAQAAADEQRLAAESRVKQLEAAVEAARIAGDIELLEKIPAAPTPVTREEPAVASLTVSPAAVSDAPTSVAAAEVQTPLALAPVTVAGELDLADLTMDMPTDMPALSFSPSDSPAHAADVSSPNDAAAMPLYTYLSDDMSYLDSSLKTHHPAVMV